MIRVIAESPYLGRPDRSGAVREGDFQGEVPAHLRPRQKKLAEVAPPRSLSLEEVLQLAGTVVVPSVVEEREKAEPPKKEEEKKEAPRQYGGFAVLASQRRAAWRVEQQRSNARKRGENVPKLKTGRRVICPPPPCPKCGKTVAKTRGLTKNKALRRWKCPPPCGRYWQVPIPGAEPAREEDFKGEVPEHFRSLAANTSSRTRHPPGRSMSEAVKSYCATLTPEQRRARTEKAVNVAREVVTPEQRREIAKMGAAAVHSASDDHKKARIAKMAETTLRIQGSQLTEEERKRKRALEASVSVYREILDRMDSDKALLFAGGFLLAKTGREVFDRCGAERLREMCREAQE